MNDSIRKEGLEIDMLPVGNGKRSGDCIAIRYGDLYAGGDSQRVVIVDGGYADTAELLKEHLWRYYNCSRNGKIHIDAIFLTHPDIDHISGLVELVRDDEVEVNCIVASIPWRKIKPSWFKDKRMTQNSLEKRLMEAFTKLEELEKLADSKRIRWIYPEDYCDNPRYCAGDKFFILSPYTWFYNRCIVNCEKTPEPIDEFTMPKFNSYATTGLKEEKYIKGKIKWDDEETTSPINESSIVFALKYGDFFGLFCGDAGKEALSKAIETARAIGLDLKKVNFIKMPHHGSRKNVTPEIMDSIGDNGTTCYISCVKGDEGHHPSKRLVNMLLEKGFRVFSSSGTYLSLSRGNTPNRGWVSVPSMGPYEKIETL